MTDDDTIGTNILSTSLISSSSGSGIVLNIRDFVFSCVTIQSENSANSNTKLSRARGPN